MILHRTGGRVASLAAALVLAALPMRAGRADDGTVSSNGPQKGGATNLDEWLAYVDGEYITRRMLVREVGERAEGQSEAEYERGLHQRLLKRVLNRAMVHKANVFGLEVKPDVLDSQVEEASKYEVDQAREREEKRQPGAGKNITFAKILADRGQTLEEYKDMISREILVQNYWHILIKGVQGKRAQFDPEPAPDELRRLYAAHRSEFDQQAGVRLAVFVLQPEDYLQDGKRKYAEALAEARRVLTAVLADVAAGRPPDEVARANGIGRGQYSVTPEGRFVEKGVRASKAADEWAFDPARKRGDTGVFDGVRGTLAGFAVLEVRPARPRRYEEVMPELIDLYRNTRIERFKIAHMLEVLGTATIQPPLLAEEIEGDLRDMLKQLDEDPVRRDIRLR